MFLALEEHESEKNPHPLTSTKLADFLKTKDGREITALVREFLEFFELDYTCAVFDPESNALESYPGREKLAQDLGIALPVSSTAPLLASVLHKSRHSSAPSSPSNHLKFSEQVTESHRTSSGINSTHPPNRRQFDDAQLPALTHGKLGQLRENDVTQKNSSLSLSLQPFSNALNTNENSNLHPDSNLMELTGDQATGLIQNGLDSAKPRDLVDLSMDSLHNRGVHAELGETLSSDNSLEIDKILNSTENLDKVAELAGMKGGSAESGRDELDDFFDNAVPTKNEKPTDLSSHISEDFSPLSSSIATGKFETEDLTLSQNSLPGGDFDYTEPVQS